MSLNINDLQQIVQEVTTFNGAYYSAGVGLSTVTSVGTTLYNDPKMLEAFPQSFPAYQLYLIDLQSHIDAFISGLPIAPPLNG